MSRDGMVKDRRGDGTNLDLVGEGDEREIASWNLGLGFSSTTQRTNRGERMLPGVTLRGRQLYVEGASAPVNT